jgi:hypothetical protein
LKILRFTLKVIVDCEWSADEITTLDTWLWALKYNSLDLESNFTCFSLRAKWNGKGACILDPLKREEFQDLLACLMTKTPGSSISEEEKPPFLAKVVRNATVHYQDSQKD